MSFAVDAYETDARQRGLAGVSILRTRAHLDVLLATKSNGGRYLTWLTAARATKLYETFRATPTKKTKKPPSVDTHRNALAAGKSFGRFCVERGWLPSDPFAAIKAKGKRRKGKPQLHRDETRKLIDVCIAEASRESIAVATSVLLGCGASEVVERTVRDLDDGGRVLHVTRGKNRFRVRSLEVPEMIREMLLGLASGRPSSARLFGVGDVDRPSRHWILYHCWRLCEVAKVKVVSVHGLRGTHTTLAIGAVSTSHSVAAAIMAAGASLGHAPGSTVTATTYAAPGAVERAQGRAALEVIQGGRGR